MVGRHTIDSHILKEHKRRNKGITKQIDHAAGQVLFLSHVLSSFSGLFIWVFALGITLSLFCPTSVSS